MKNRYLIVLLAVVFASARGGAQASDPSAVWRTTDIGQVSISGSAEMLSCTPQAGSCPHIMMQSSASRSAATEEVTFLHQQLAGDSQVVARVYMMTGGGLEGASGVSVRTALTPGAPAVTLWLTRSGRLNFDVRQQAGAAATRRDSTSAQQSVWLKLERRGHEVSGFVSVDGSQWTALGSAVLPPATSMFVGLLAGSQDPTTRLTATLSDVRAAPLSTLLSGWSSSDVGPPLSGAGQYFNGYFVAATGGGTSTGTADNLRFLNTRVTGDVEFVARVVAGGTFVKVEAGVMLRESLAADAANVRLAISRTSTRVVGRRVAAGLPLQESVGGARVTPWWLKIVRRGTLITTFESANGTTWTPVSSDVLTLPSSFYVGLYAVAAAGSFGHGVFDSVAIAALAGNRPPQVSVTAPLSDASLTAGTSVAMSATAADADDRVERVEFYVDGRLVGMDTATPYGAIWSNVTSGTHVITAVAVDSEGARVTSAPVTVGAVSTPTTADPVKSTDTLIATQSTTTSSPSGWTYTTPITSGSTTSTSTTSTSTTSTMFTPFVGAPAPPPVTPWRLVFSPSADHDHTVDRYRLEVYALSPRRLVLGQDLGRPPVVAGECTIDVSQAFSALTAGQYEVVVTAVDDATYLSSVGATATFTR